MHPRHFFIPASLAVLALGLSACDSATASNDTSTNSTSSSSSSTTTTVALSNPAIDTTKLVGTTKDSAAASALTATAMGTASSAFKKIFNGKANSAQDNPLGNQELALSSAQKTMATAFANDPNNSKTSFGLAVTSLALRTQKLAVTFQSMQDSGLTIGNTSQPLLSNISSIESSTSALARAMATPAKAPELDALQDTLQYQFLPTLDSAIFLMQKAWRNTSFTFKVYDNNERDSLTLDRSDLGYALAIAKAVRASVCWFISYDFNIAYNGSYAWIDTLGHIGDNDPVLPTSVDQKNAWTHFKSLVSSGSSFLKVRTGKESLHSSVASQFQEAVTLAVASTNLAYQIKANQTHLLVPQMTSTQKGDLLRALDSASLWLAGPRTITLSWSKCQDIYSYRNSSVNYSYTDTSFYYEMGLLGLKDPCPASFGYSGSSWSDSNTYSVKSTQTNQTRFSLPALLSLSDFKVFLPSTYTWNDTGDWDQYGPILFTNRSQFINIQALGDTISNRKSYLPLKTWIQWSDPTFGGVFPDLKQGDVFDIIFKGSELNSTSVKSAARLTSALRLLP